MTCILEKTLAAMLHAASIAFTVPERDNADPINLDFYLPDLRIYIEVKQFHTPRIADQLAKVPERVSVIVLQGPSAVADFAKLCRALARPSAIEEAATAIGNARQSEAGLFDAKHSGQRGCDRSDAFHDAYQIVKRLLG